MLKTKSFLLALLASLATAPTAMACPDIGGLADLNCDGQVRILCHGDSITAGERDDTGLGYPGRLQSFVFPGVNVKNAGSNGEKTDRGRERFVRYVSQPQNKVFDYIIILEGVNDYFTEERSASETRSNLGTMLRSAQNTGAVSLLGSLTDVRRDFQQGWVRSVNSQIRGSVRIDFFSLGTGIISSDKLHPNDAGYQRMADLAGATLRQYSNASRPADLDQDGIYDFAETRFFADPAKADTDGDGVLDGMEVFIYKSNPTLVDTDGDGISDYEEEIVRHTNPLSALPAAPAITELRALP